MLCVCVRNVGLNISNNKRKESFLSAGTLP